MKLLLVITNGEVLSLVNDNNTIFVGTRTTDGKGRLFKVVYTVAIGIFSWSSSGGEVHSLLNVNGIVYVGTKISDNKGKLFKSLNPEG